MRAPLSAIAAICVFFSGRGILPADSTPATLPVAVLITNAAEILDLSTTQAGQALPVLLHGVVVDDAEPRERAVIVWDQSASIYVSAPGNIFAPYHRRDLLEISGVTSPGEYAPCVRATEVKRLGRGDPPVPTPVTYQQLITGALDAQYVEISGVVRQCWPAAAGAKTWRIVLAADGGLIPVRIPIPTDPQIQPDSEVTLVAVCLYQFNQNRQALSPVLQVPRGVPVVIKKVSPAEPFAAPVRTAASLLQYTHDLPFGHRIHVHGVVTRAEPGSQVWIRDTTAGLRIQIGQNEDLRPGDEIDVLGFPGSGLSAPVLEDAIFRKIKSESPPVPLTIGNATNALEHQDDLISLDAILTDVQPVLSGLVLTLEQNKTVCKAVLKLPLNVNRQFGWQKGSLVHVAGICDVIYDSSLPVMGIWHPQSFQVLLRSPDDVAVIKMPPWWTGKHVIYLLGIFAGTSLMASAVALSLARRRLNQQARRRAMAEAEFAAILSERNRLAREIHDTLAQGLTATAVQLQLVKIHANGASESMSRHLNKAQQMIRDSLEEARNSIWKMRAQVLETGDLVMALKNILEQLSEGTARETRFQVTGRERRLPAIIENNVLRLGQEAITNAVKHAGAKRIDVKLEFGEKHFSLTVSDDGRGFDPKNPPRSEGGLGLVGMSERAKELSGKLNVLSEPNFGTEINLNIPLVGE